MLFDSFQGTGSIVGSISESRHFRNTIAGTFALASGLLTTVTASAKMSWGRVSESGVITAILKTTPEQAPARVYFNCDESLQNGFFVEYSDGIVLCKVVAGVSTALENHSGLDASLPCTVIVNRSEGLITDVIASDGITTVRTYGIHSLSDHDIDDVMGVELQTDGGGAASSCVMVFEN